MKFHQGNSPTNWIKSERNEHTVKLDTSTLRCERVRIFNSRLIIDTGVAISNGNSWPVEINVSKRTRYSLFLISAIICCLRFFAIPYPLYVMLQK